MTSLWKNRTFVLVTSSDLLQNLAIWVRNMAILFYVMEQSGHDPVAVSAITVLEFAPIFLFSLIGGALADRWNPKRTMIAGDILSFASIVMLMAVLQSGWWQAIYLATFVSGMVSQFSQPSSAKLFKRNVPEDQVPTAIGATQSLHALFLIGGPIVGTFVYRQLGLNASLGTLLILFAASALLLSLLPAGIREKASVKASMLREIREGWRYVAGHAVLRPLAIVFAVLGFAAGLVQPLEVFLITDRLGLEMETVQYLSAAAGFGLLIGGVASMALASKANPRTILVLGLVLFGVTCIVEALSTWLWLTMSMRFLSAVTMAAVNMVVGAQLIAVVEERLVGRVNGTVTPIFTLTLLLGSSLAGVMMKATSLITVFALSAAILCAAAFLAGRRNAAQQASSASGPSHDPGGAR